MGGPAMGGPAMGGPAMGNSAMGGAPMGGNNGGGGGQKPIPSQAEYIHQSYWHGDFNRNVAEQHLARYTRVHLC
jgi:hypothetical protein